MLKIFYCIWLTTVQLIRHGYTESTVTPSETVPTNWREALDESVLTFPSVAEPSFQPHEPDSRTPGGPVDKTLFSGRKASRPQNGKLTWENFWSRNGNKVVIPCRFEGRFETEQVNRITVALQRIEQQTGSCVTFARIDRTLSNRQPPDAHIVFVYHDRKECFTEVGKRDSNPIYLDSHCANDMGRIMHEVMHKLGFFHEHSRPDRGDYVRIRTANIKSEFHDQFYIIAHMETYGFDYDHESILHYGALTAAVNEDEPSMTPRTHYARVLMGQRFHLSDTDVKKIRVAYNCSSRENVSADLDAIKKTWPSKSPLKGALLTSSNFSFYAMTKEEWSQQEIGQICKFPVRDADAQAAARARALAISCTKDVTRDVLQAMAHAMSKGPSRSVGIFLHDNPKNIQNDTFNTIANNVVILLLRQCYTERTTSKPRTLGFFRLLMFHLSNCSELAIRKSDFSGLNQLRMISFSNTTVRTLDTDTFTNLPQLVTLSLEFGANLLHVKTVEYERFLDRLHCGCEFSWFRRWLQSDENKKFHSRGAGEIYNLRYSWVHPGVSSRVLHLLYDCRTSSIETAPDDENMARFSLNDDKCKRA